MNANVIGAISVGAVPVAKVHYFIFVENTSWLASFAVGLSLRPICIEVCVGLSKHMEACGTGDAVHTVIVVACCYVAAIIRTAVERADSHMTDSTLNMMPIVCLLSSSRLSSKWSG